MSRRAWPWLAALGVAALAAAVIVTVIATRGPSHRRPRVVPAPAVRIQPALATPATEQFGVAVNQLFLDGTYSPSQIATALAALHATGATVARTDALWEATEPGAPSDGRHRYDWTFDDVTAADLATAHLTWQPIIDYSTAYARSIPTQDHSPPNSDADYAAYAQAFAARYGAGGAFWKAHPTLPYLPVTTIEIWNEPDNPVFWVPTPNPAAYAELYRYSRMAIDAVAPSTRVIVGGLTDPSQFIPEMVKAVPWLVGHVDGIAIHPYGPPSEVRDRIRNARLATIQAGLGTVPLYVTEFGWTTSPATAPGYAPPSIRPAEIRTVFDELGHTNCNLAEAMLYTWTTPETDLGDAQDWYGVYGQAPYDAASVLAVTEGLHAAQTPGPTLSWCASG